MITRNRSLDFSHLSHNSQKIKQFFSAHGKQIEEAHTRPEKCTQIRNEFHINLILFH
eukprot:TRINITY_DN1841_c0_g1_i1.p1 TRINITY_DN1841_c0_g1~~TRINITY_DN1841_c0_g1_i1.p1  ORF type:complete len:57 (+),score=3.00 TRINITY_DN1841_c0_g1_i1:55-225(+)